MLCCNLLICRPPCRNRTAACPQCAIADATLTFAEIRYRHLRICLLDRHRFLGHWRKEMARKTLGASRPQLRSSQAWSHTVFHGLGRARESRSTRPGQLRLRRAAIRNVQCAGATNARPFRRLASLPVLHREAVASCVAHSPNGDKIRPPLLRSHAAVYRRAWI